MAPAASSAGRSYSGEQLTNTPESLSLGDLVIISSKMDKVRVSLVAQWLRIRLPMQGDMGSSPGPGRSHMPQSN